MRKLLVACLVLLSMGTSPRVATAFVQPNIIIVITDDQNYDTLWGMPTLQWSIAPRGTVFTQAFASTPLCCPARASLLTGQYAYDTDVLRNSPPHGGWASFDDTQTLAVWAQAKGYRTALIGKYMNGYQEGYTPPGWDVFCPFIGNGAYYGASFWCEGETVWIGNQGYSTDFIFERAAAFIQSTPANQPYLLVITPRASHAPFEAATQDRGLFSWWSYSSAALNEDTSDKCSHLHGLPPKNVSNMQSQARRQQETLLSVDRGLANLEGLINWSKTIFAYTSDQGYLLGDHRLNDKGSPYERAIHVPLVVVTPGGIAGQVSDSLIVQPDITRTVAALARIYAPTGWDWAGRSFHRTLLYGKAGLRTNFPLMQFPQLNDDTKPGFIGVRSRQYKLIEFANGCREFYDLTLDPFELDNQINNPVYASQIKIMLNQVKPIRARMDTLGWRD